MIWSWLIIAAATVLLLIIIRFIATHARFDVSVLPPEQEHQALLLAGTVSRVKCSRCSGGTQGLTGGAWGPFPREILMIERTPDGDDIHRPPHASIRPCLGCAGRGFFLVHRPTNVTHDRSVT